MANRMLSSKQVIRAAQRACLPSLLRPLTAAVISHDRTSQDFDYTAAIAFLSESTAQYDIDPSSIPDGLGHLVNYGALT